MIFLGDKVGEVLLISERIFELMKENDMTQKDFSKQTEIPQSTISDWKRKKTNPTAEKILRICEVLHVTPYELLTESDVVLPQKSDYMVATNDQEIYLLEVYRNLSIKQRNRLMGYLEALQETE